MRVVRNVKYLASRRRSSRLMVLAGVLGLGSSIAMTFFQELILPAYVVLIFGFLFFNAGMQQVAKWNRRPRADEVLDQHLRRRNDRYTLIHYPNMPGQRPEHVLIYPSGLLVIVTRDLAGQVRVEGNRWRRLGSRVLRMFLMGGPHLGNPTIECLRHQETLQNFLEEHGLAGGDLIEGMIVFLNPRAELEVISSDLTVIKLDELEDAIRDLGTEPVLTAKERDDIVDALSQGEGVEGPTSLSTRKLKRPKGARAG